MIETPYDYLMNICTACYLICYVPDLYGNYKNKNANIWNIPEKVMIFFGTGFALAYAILNNDSALITNFAPLFVLDGASMSMRSYYAYQNQRQKYLIMPANLAANDSSGTPADDLSQTTSPHPIQV